METPESRREGVLYLDEFRKLRLETDPPPCTASQLLDELLDHYIRIGGILEELTRKIA